VFLYGANGERAAAPMKSVWNAPPKSNPGARL
jgi:hypothetical protein